jgi:hypothetical protein
MGPLEALNDTKLILNDYGDPSCLFRTNLVSFITFWCPLLGPYPIAQTSFLVGTFFTVSNNKQAVAIHEYSEFVFSFLGKKCGEQFKSQYTVAWAAARTALFARTWLQFCSVLLIRFVKFAQGLRPALTFPFFLRYLNSRPQIFCSMGGAKIATEW